jgi:hypothetical protein
MKPNAKGEMKGEMIKPIVQMFSYNDDTLARSRSSDISKDLPFAHEDGKGRYRSRCTDPAGTSDEMVPNRQSFSTHRNLWSRSEER